MKKKHNSGCNCSSRNGGPSDGPEVKTRRNRHAKQRRGQKSQSRVLNWFNLVTRMNLSDGSTTRPLKTGRGDCRFTVTCNGSDLIVEFLERTTPAATLVFTPETREGTFRPGNNGNLERFSLRRKSSRKGTAIEAFLTSVETGQPVESANLAALEALGVPIC